MFDEYAKRLEKLETDVPKIFKNVAERAAIHFVNKAEELTDKEKLVDTGNYKRNWNAEVTEPTQGEYGIVCSNSAEYASFLEEGHKTRSGRRTKGHFVGKQALNDTEAEAIFMLQTEVDIAFLQKEHGISRSEAKKYIQ